MRRRLTLEYDGGDFIGWQIQPTGRSVQGELEAGLASVFGESIRVHGAGRTDAGVHATGQVAHFDASGRLSAIEVRNALNWNLADDIAVRDARVVAHDFDARRHALKKRYVYRILNRAEPAPLRRGVAWHLRRPLEVEPMREAAAVLVGHHDFAAFRGAPKGLDPAEDTIRTLLRLDVERAGDEWRFVAEGKSFLRYMVRNLVGTLVEVGQGRRKPADVAAVLAAGDRSRAGKTAPAHGLCLAWIAYGEQRPGGGEGGR